MNESFVENHLNAAEIRNFDKFKCTWSSCGEYLAVSVLNQNHEGTLVFYDNEYRLIEPQTLSKDHLVNKVNIKVLAFEWSPNLPIVACVFEDEGVAFFRIKHDTKRWIYYDAVIGTNDDKSSKLNKSDDDSSDESTKETLNSSLILRIIHLSWLNEGNTLYYVTNKGQVKFFDFNLTDSVLKQVANLQIKDELTHCIEVYFDQHSKIYLSSKTGLIYLIDELSREAIKIIQLKCPILKMIYLKRKSRFIIISDDFVLYQYNILNQSNEQNYVELCSVKLEVLNKSFSHVEKLVDKRKAKKGKSTASFKQDDIFILKIDENLGIIGVCIAGERVIRLFQIDSGHNLAVIAIESTDYQWSGVSYLLYDEITQLLLAGTSNNQFLVWRRVEQTADNRTNERTNSDEVNEYSKQFEFVKLAQFLFEGTINCISVNRSEKIALISNSSDICLIEKQILNFTFLDGLAIIQVNARDLKLIWLNSPNQDELIVSLGENVKEVYQNPSLSKLAIRTNRSNELTIIRLCDHQTYEIIKTLQIVQNFKFVLQENYVWQLNLDLNSSKTLTNNQGLSINCYSLNGQDEQQIYAIDLENSFKANERIQLTVLDSTSNYLLIIVQSEQLTQNYCYLVYEMIENEVVAKCRATLILVNDRIVEAKINSNGTMIAIVDGSQVFLVQVGSDELHCIKLGIQQIDQIYFASNEPRLLCIQNGLNLFILICYIQTNDMLSERSINYQLYDRKYVDEKAKVIGFQIPYIYILIREESLQLIKESFNEFDEIQMDVVRLIIDFLTNRKDLNLMIKRISKISQGNDQSERNLWLNLARCSVKSRNVEMGLYCMAKLKDVRVIRDVQNELRSKTLTNESRENLALAILAMNLNLFQEAEELFKQSDNNLKLVHYYQCRNDWNLALNSIEKLNERSVFYDYAKYYENELSEIENAIKYYELSGTNCFEVTRMLFDLNELNKLKNYCYNRTIHKNKSTDENELTIELKRLRQWYGQYCESIGDFQSSLKAYAQANDQYNQVRLLCLIGNLDDAKKIVNVIDLNKKIIDDGQQTIIDQQEKQSRNAAMLHLGKHLESQDPVEAVQYFLNCGAINHAIKTCKANQFDEQLSKIIQNYGSKNEIIELVKKLDETEENFENLFNLYLKIEMIDKCLRIGFQGRLWSQLRMLLNNYRTFKNGSNELKKQIDLDDAHTLTTEKVNQIEISDETIELALEYLKNNSQIIDIVINMLLIKGDHRNLIRDLILDYKIDINNEFIEKIEQLFDETKDESRSLLQSLADSAMIQGKYLIAAKLFNSINDRINSIKALTRLGDVQKVINYANISRDKNIYKIAASFLQTTQGNEKTVEIFYRKANVKRDSNKLFD